VQNIGTLDLDKFKGISSNILNNEVVLTDKQLAHITSKRAEVFEKYRDKLPEIVDDPDYVFSDPKHTDTALVVKQYDKSAMVVLRLATQTTDKKNSILTLWEISEPRLQRYISTHESVYKKE
jgi:hypothetical protein